MSTPKVPFTIDIIVRALDRTICSPLGALLVAAYRFYQSRQIYGQVLHLSDFLLSKNERWLRYLLIWVALKSANRVLNRLALNKGWSRDRPDWKSGKEVVVITGGAGGIGGDIVELLAERTSKVAVLDVASPTYKAKNVKYYKCDVTDEAAVHAVGEEIRRDLGHPTILINNAGIGQGKKIGDLTAEEFLMTFKVNCLAAFIIVKEFLPHIVNHNHGHIMTVASSASYMSIPNLSEYSASKSGVLAFHEVLTAELVARYNAPRVRTSVICPTKVQTQMGAAMKDTDVQFISPTLLPHQVARDAVSIINSGLSDHLVTPLSASLLLPNIRSFPHWYRWLIEMAGKTYNTVTDERGSKARANHRNHVEQLEATEE